MENCNEVVYNYKKAFGVESRDVTWKNILCRITAKFLCKRAFNVESLN